MDKSEEVSGQIHWTQRLRVERVCIVRIRVVSVVDSAVQLLGSPS